MAIGLEHFRKAGAPQSLRSSGRLGGNDRPLTNPQIGKSLDKAQEYRLQTVRCEMSVMCDGVIRIYASEIASAQPIAAGWENSSKPEPTSQPKPLNLNHRNTA